MLTPNDTNNLMTLFKHNEEDVNALTELAASDEILRDKLDTLAGELDTVSDLVYDIHDYLYELKAKKHETIRNDFSTPYYAAPYYTAPYYDNRTPMGFAANRNGHVCPYCHDAYMNGYMTCPECHRTL